MTMTPQQKYDLLMQISHARRHADAYFDTVGDAAVAAVNQVQDIRLELGTRPATVSGIEFFMEIFLSVALLDVGKALVAGPLTKLWATKIVNSRALVGRLSVGRKTVRKKLATGVTLRREIGVDGNQKITEKLVTDVNRRRTINSYVDFVEQMRIDKAMIDKVEWGATIVYDRTAKTARKSDLRNNGNPLQPDTTPGVAILQSALVYTRDQQKLNHLHFDRLKDLVSLDLIDSQSDVDDIYDTLNDLCSPPKYGKYTYNLRGVHAHYLIFFEFCIWSLLIIGDAITKKKDDLFTGVNSEPHLKFFDDWDKDVDLTNYLLRRHHQWRDEYSRKEKQGKEAFRRWAGNATLQLLDTLQEIYNNSNRVQSELGRYVRHARKS